MRCFLFFTSIVSWIWRHAFVANWMTEGLWAMQCLQSRLSCCQDVTQWRRHPAAQPQAQHVGNHRRGCGCCLSESPRCSQREWATGKGTVSIVIVTRDLAYLKSLALLIWLYVADAGLCLQVIPLELDSETSLPVIAFIT